MTHTVTHVHTLVACRVVCVCVCVCVLARHGTQTHIDDVTRTVVQSCTRATQGRHIWKKKKRTAAPTAPGADGSSAVLGRT